MRLAFLMTMSLIFLSGKTLFSHENIIYAVQPKTTTLSSRFETILSGVYSLNNRYVNESGLALSGLYHLRENLAVELQGNWLLRRHNSELYRKITSIETGDIKNAFAVVNYYRATWLLNAALEWSVLYGKLSFYDVALGDVGIYALAGIGLVGLELTDPANSLVSDKILKGNGILPFQFTTPFGVGMRIHFAQHFGLRFELRDNVQVLWAPQGTAQSVTSLYDVSHKIWLTFGVAYVF